jgi:hypothetical protein
MTSLNDRNPLGGAAPRRGARCTVRRARVAARGGAPALNGLARSARSRGRGAARRERRSHLRRVLTAAPVRQARSVRHRRLVRLRSTASLGVGWQSSPVDRQRRLRTLAWPPLRPSIGASLVDSQTSSQPGHPPSARVGAFHVSGSLVPDGSALVTLPILAGRRIRPLPATSVWSSGVGSRHAVDVA